MRFARGIPAFRCVLFSFSRAGVGIGLRVRRSRGLLLALRKSHRHSGQEEQTRKRRDVPIVRDFHCLISGGNTPGEFHGFSQPPAHGSENEGGHLTLRGQGDVRGLTREFRAAVQL